MVDLPDVLAAALGAHSGNMASLARGVSLSPSSVGRWFAGVTKPDYGSCLALAALTNYSPEDVLVAAGHDPRLLPATADSSTAKQSVSVRQQAIRDQRDRWVAVLGPTMGDEAAENYFWESLKRLADNILDALTVGTAVSSPTDGAVSAAVSRRAKRGRRGDDGSSGTLRVRQHPSADRLEPLRQGFAASAAA